MDGVNKWIQIGEPEVPRLSLDAQKVFRLIQFTTKTHYQLIRKVTGFGDDRITESIYEIRKMEAIRMGKLNNQQRAAIYAASKDGVPQKDLAKQYGVSIQAISQLINKLAKAEQGINLGTCETADKKPVATINKEFDDAVNAMVAKKESANAEEKSTIAAEVTPSGIPAAVMRAVAGGLDVLKMDIEAREERIAELQAEIEEIRKDIAVIEAWKEEHKR